MASESKNDSYESRRGEVETYFDRTAADKWEKMTSNDPLGKIRMTVREGRDQMRVTLLSWLPADLTGKRLLDAGCGPGMLAQEAARRGADVVAVDLSQTLIDLGRERAARENLKGSIDFRVGDAYSPDLGDFDHIVAMDSLIHYDMKDCVQVLAGMAPRTRGSIVFTYAPRTTLLALMHSVGKLFPRHDRSPAIVPLGQDKFYGALAGAPGLSSWTTGRTARISRGFYISQGLELHPK